MSKKKLVLNIFGGCIILYILFCLTVYLQPQWFFYRPSKKISDLEQARAAGYSAERVDYRAADGQELYAWFTKPQKGEKIIVFMHGNSYNLEAFYHKMMPLIEAGYGAMLPEYRGFGGLDGKISEPNLGNDAIAAVEWLHQQGYQNKDIILYGMSLGSYTATNTAYVLGQKNPFAALILEVPFDSLLNVVRKVVPVPLPLSLIIKDKYDNLSKISQIKTPLLILGAEKDATVPVELAQNLFAHAAEPKKIIVYSGAAHHNLYDYNNYSDILNWLRSYEKTR